jgi:hypothetical protein
LSAYANGKSLNAHGGAQTEDPGRRLLLFFFSRTQTRCKCVVFVCITPLICSLLPDLSPPHATFTIVRNPCGHDTSETLNQFLLRRCLRVAGVVLETLVRIHSPVLRARHLLWCSFRSSIFSFSRVLLPPNHELSDAQVMAEV